MKTERNNVLVQITRPFGVMSLGPCIQPSMMLMYATSGKVVRIFPFSQLDTY